MRWSEVEWRGARGGVVRRSGRVRRVESGEEGSEVLTPLLTTLLTHHSPIPLNPPPGPMAAHHSLKGPTQTKGFVKSHFSISINLCRIFLSFKTSFLTISGFCKTNLGQNRPKIGNMMACTCKIAHVQCNVVESFFQLQLKYLSKIPLFYILK